MQRGVMLGFTLLVSIVLWSQGTARIMFYNLLDFPEAPPANRVLILKDILGVVQPDVFMVAELQDSAGADLILESALNISSEVYASAPFVVNTSGGGNIQQLLYFNTDKFSLELTDIIQTSLRDINRYQLKAKTDQSETDPILLDFFVAHFKASQGDVNEQIRFDMAMEFTDYINSNLTADANVVFAGDFNFYSANESGFQQLFIGNTIIPMNDPVNQLGAWHTNSGFSAVHTQSTRQSSNSFNGFGAGGGLDDRFDFIFLSANLLDTAHQVSYVNDSYQTIGNNGNCFNEDISDISCGGVYNQGLRNLLWNMSDHLPLALDLNFQQNFLSINKFVDQPLVLLPAGNVVSHTLEIFIPHQILQEVNELKIYNSVGQQIDLIRVKSSSTIVSFSQLSNGIYYIQADNAQVLKFVKVN